MVILSYGNEPNEQDAREEGRFQSLWEREKNRIAQTTPFEYHTKLCEIYSRTPNERLDLDPISFVNEVTFRIYTEWRMGEGINKNHLAYKGEGFLDFIRDETYLASERAVKKGLISLPISSRTEDEIKGKVLEAVVKRAIELFSDWGGNTSPPEGSEDKRNLRDNLENYIEF